MRRRRSLSLARRRRSLLLAPILALLVACQAEATPSVLPSASTASAAATPSPVVSASEAATEAPSDSPSPTPEPALSLDLPDDRDGRTVSVSLDTDLPSDADGTITVTVTSQADARIDELVLRWPTELRETLFLAPFVPSEDRIRDGGPPLVQEWTKWVVGPGERGEPAGTTSLGYGPLLPGATLTIPLYVTRTAPGSVAFDLQLLSGNDLLSLADGTPAEMRVEV